MTDKNFDKILEMAGDGTNLKFTDEDSQAAYDSINELV